MESGMQLKNNNPIGYLWHEPTFTSIAVYHKIPKIQRWFIKTCFGLVYDNMED